MLKQFEGLCDVNPFTSLKFLCYLIKCPSRSKCCLTGNVIKSCRKPFVNEFSSKCTWQLLNFIFPSNLDHNAALATVKSVTCTRRAVSHVRTVNRVRQLRLWHLLATWVVGFQIPPQPTNFFSTQAQDGMIKNGTKSDKMSFSAISMWNQ